MNLHAPRQIYFVIAVVIAIIALISVLTTALAFIPISAFWLMTIAFIVLAVACIVKL